MKVELAKTKVELANAIWREMMMLTMGSDMLEMSRIREIASRSDEPLDVRCEAAELAYDRMCEVRKLWQAGDNTKMNERISDPIIDTGSESAQ